MRLRWLKALLWALCLYPLALLAWRTWHGQLGPNPVETLEHATGLRALQLLLATLAMTPLRSLSGRPEPLQLRRTLGLFAYFYMCLHFAAYLVFDLSLSLPKLGEDLVKRTYITLGFGCWLFLLPLAVTSTDGWQRRLKRRWKTLHRLIYPAALLASLHFVWLVKKDETEPLSYLAVLLALLALRLPWRRWLRGILSPQTTQT
ncbi:MAG: sulfoxide reductase heme-binding subunit YedZ [Nevskia sp.]|nr:sulfoxide reductase heme-binding subunit YedZ [Nevskia sp.]